MADETRTPAEEVQRLYEQAETSTAKAMEDLVSRDAFGALLARMTENVMGVVQIGNTACDLLVRNLRLAGRQDITRLGRQLARTEDKLELVLQEVERVSARLDAVSAAPAEADNGRAEHELGLVLQEVERISARLDAASTAAAEGEAGNGGAVREPRAQRKT